MRLSISFNDDDPKAMRACQILMDAGHKKAQLISTLMTVLEERFPALFADGFTSADVNVIIRMIECGMFFSPGVTPVRKASTSVPKPKRQKRSSAKKSVPERPKLIEPIPDLVPTAEAEAEAATEQTEQPGDYSTIATDEEMAAFEKLQSYGW